jgi:transcriptional regulator with XRE-family HTH domain
VGVSQRVVAYYERADAQPPGAMLNELARALRVRIEELLGTKPIPDQTHPKTARLLKRLRRVEELPPADQRTVLKILDGLLAARQGRVAIRRVGGLSKRFKHAPDER